MSASYTVGSTAAKAGSVPPHPDQPAGSGVSLPVSINSTYTTMAQVHASMTNMAWREVLADSDSVVYRTSPTSLIAAFRSFPAQRLFSSFTPREIPDGSGGVNIEFVSKSSSRCLTLESALGAVGFISTGLFSNSSNTAAEIVACNTQLEWYNQLKSIAISFMKIKNETR